ncbi:hypothetical protein ZTR_04289 [Talaromyces verruculosus]|nr:hypothetical protein ZTR_04289 [Talaromyces verruculosus]
MISKKSSIIIIGGGAFGLSTALHLVQNGYENITVFEQGDQIPARQSAANDLNKIVRAEYEDPFYTDLAIKAVEAWKTPLFAPHFHQTGFLHCVSAAAPEKAIDTLRRFETAATRHARIEPHVLPLNGKDDIRRWFWQADGHFPGWKGYINRFDGYAHSGNALATIHKWTQSRGVRYFLGEHGAVSQIVYRHGKSIGIRTVKGQFHAAGVVIVAAGAAAAKLVPEIGTWVVAKSWSVAHVRLTDDETSALRGIPVTYARDLGFFFEPDPKTNLLKLCPMGGGYINTDKTTGVSHAPDTPETSAFIPPEDESQIRRLLAQTLPQLSNRPLVRTSLCWFADTKDSDFIIDYLPNTSSSVVVLSGDSGHGFKMFPIVGSWVRDLLEAPDNKQHVVRWQWKQIEAEHGGNWGGDVSWRLGESRELKDILPGRVKLNGFMSEGLISMFSSAPLIPADAIFALTAEYLTDTHPRKINLGQGAYRDDNGRPFVLPSVLESRRIIVERGLEHEYLPILGLAKLGEKAVELVLGSAAAAKISKRTLSGTGALHLAGNIIKYCRKSALPAVYIPNPTWSNHHLVYSSLGFECRSFRYYDDKTKSLDFDSYRSTLRTAEPGSIIILHACAHNPTGLYPSTEQWKEIGTMMKDRSLFPLFDAAYLGFDSGDFEKDSFPIRLFVNDLGLEAGVNESVAFS